MLIWFSLINTLYQVQGWTHPHLLTTTSGAARLESSGSSILCHVKSFRSSLSLLVISIILSVITLIFQQAFLNLKKKSKDHYLRALPKNMKTWERCHPLSTNITGPRWLSTNNLFPPFLPSFFPSFFLLLLLLSPPPRLSFFYGFK